ncbi:sigma-54-dependent Fis family transcriptional regulator [Paenibacillus sp. J31TS4]|uniref:sigma-54-dependent Fis family transcriptional regulator n=1 Tax=Paenibacillus sp. J31TS4 TaxID=2807195 RepID=UPI001B16A8EB|nr:sigma-54-dependent Fis family transcriptional regulator [Paenibacillus sp. J31TS4]GIP40058.1 sigma-54-dependent Fis family transcriptional regulator [Paenibacillus sp. J31TS4]
MGVKVMAIAPYPGLKELILEMARELPHFEVRAEVGDLTEGVRLARQAEAEGCDLIISRGGTANLIRSAVSLPVVDIGISGYDLLRVFTLVKESASRVGIVGFPNICNGARLIGSLLDLNVPMYELGSEDEVVPVVRRAVGDGVQLVLGDAVSVRTAQRLGYHGVLITSGRESIEKAFEDAWSLYQAIEREKEQSRLLEAALGASGEGLVVAEAGGAVRYANPAACELLGLGTEKPESVRLPERIAGWAEQWPGGLPEPGPGRIVRLNGRSLTIRAERLPAAGRSGAVVLAIRPAPAGAEDAREAVEAAAESRALPATFGQILGHAPAIRAAVDRARSYALSDANLWLDGEPGTGRLLFARAIHSASARSTGPFVAVCCSSPAWRDDWFGRDGGASAPERARGGTLYLAGVEEAPDELLAEARRLMEEPGRPVRVIGSTEGAGGARRARGERGAFLERLGELYLPLPPLRERKEDIPELCRVFIAQANEAFGRQVVGVREEALRLLAGLPWPRNVSGLKRAVEELVLGSGDFYIEEEQARELAVRLGAEPKRGGQERAGGAGAEDAFVLSVPREATLSELERLIIERVLEEEGGNQSRAAKRLGINRTTLWRKAKEAEPGE